VCFKKPRLQDLKQKSWKLDNNQYDTTRFWHSVAFPTGKVFLASQRWLKRQRESKAPHIRHEDEMEDS